jgi:hypothetical protein
MNMKKKIILPFIVIFLFFSININPTNSCDSNLLKNADRNPELAYRRFSNRCEGFYGVTVANTTFQVAGLTIGKLIYAMDRKEIVSISLPHHPNKTIHIQAMAIPDKTFYRMDAELEPGMTLFWPMNDIIYKRPKELTSDKIGILAWIKEGDSKIYLPVRAQSCQKGTDSDKTIQLIVSPSEDIGSFMWRIIKDSSKCKAFDSEWKIPKEKKDIYRKGLPITIQLPTKLTSIVYLELTARIKNQEGWTTESIHLSLGNENLKKHAKQP